MYVAGPVRIGGIFMMSKINLATRHGWLLMRRNDMTEINQFLIIVITLLQIYVDFIL